MSLTVLRAHPSHSFAQMVLHALESLYRMSTCGLSQVALYINARALSVLGSAVSSLVPQVPTLSLLSLRRSRLVTPPLLPCLGTFQMASLPQLPSQFREWYSFFFARLELNLMTLCRSGIPTSFYPGLSAYSKLMSAQGSTALPGGGATSTSTTKTTSTSTTKTSTTTTKTTSATATATGVAAHVSPFILYNRPALSCVDPIPFMQHLLNYTDISVLQYSTGNVVEVVSTLIHLHLYSTDHPGRMDRTNGLRVAIHMYIFQ
jgi:hypothetical protein